jgi:hypothetical protein
MSVTPETIDLTGMWRLVRVTNWTNGVLTNPHGMGSAPGGYISYTREGRMMVVLDRRSVREGAKSRFGNDPIFCYAGRYTRAGNVVTHHLELCTALADIGTDYVRNIELAGDNLVLCAEPVTRGDKTYVAKLEWERDRGM